MWCLELSEEQEKGLSSDVEAAMVTHLSAVRQYASVFSSKSTTAPSGSFGARMVNPSNNKVRFFFFFFVWICKRHVHGIFAGCD